jgi:hypothetical protein
MADAAKETRGGDDKLTGAERETSAQTRCNCVGGLLL